MTTILLRPDELTRNTILGGNIDVDKYLPCIKACQNTMIKPLLGEELYDKMCIEFENNTLIGKYLELYENYLKDMVIHGSSQLYTAVGAYTVSNVGITKIKTEDTETIDKTEVDYLVNFCERLYNHYEREFLKWIKLNPLPEYTNMGCNSSSNVINVGGWSLRRN